VLLMRGKCAMEKEFFVLQFSYMGKTEAHKKGHSFE